MTGFRGFGLAGTVALVLACTIAASAQAAGRPDLAVSDLEVLTPSVEENQAVEVEATVRNAGKKTAPKSGLGLYLSANRRQDKRDKPLKGGLKVKKLAKGKRAVATGDAKLPGSAKPGAYELLACADQKTGIKEGNERNNCRPASGKIGISDASQPVGVTPRFDESNASDNPIPATGGSAGAFAADGTAYSLIVPDGALTHDVNIRMTPLNGVDGLPLSGGMVAGVQIGNDSLQFAKPALLVIQRGGLAPSPSQVAFGYHGSGSDFFLSPFGQRPEGYPPESIVVPVTHGGGWGVADAGDADVAAQQAKLPRRAEDRLAQAGANLGGSVRSRDVTTRGLDVDAIRVEARRLYDQVIGPQMKAAETNDAILDKAASDAFGWMRQLALLGLDSEFSAEFDQIMVSLEKGLENAYQKAKERCFGGDFGQVSRLLGIERFRQLMGFSDESSNVMTDVDKCLRFELRVSSHIEVHEHPDFGRVDIVADLGSTVPLQLNYETMRLSGEAPFEYRHFTLDAETHTNFFGCQLDGTSRSTGQLQNGQLTVPSGIVTLGDPGAPPGPPEISMLIDPGQPQEQVHTESQSSCFGSGSGTDWEQNWLDQWTTWFHPPDSVSDNTSGPWMIDNFTPGSSPIVGQRTFIETVGARNLNETWEVVHTPDRS